MLSWTEPPCLPLEQLEYAGQCRVEFVGGGGVHQAAPVICVLAWIGLPVYIFWKYGSAGSLWYTARPFSQQEDRSYLA